MASEQDILLAKRIISAAERHDVPVLQLLLKEGSANVQDPTASIATSPLHAAIASCGKAEDGKEADENAVNTVELLLQNGAIWNDLNKEDETPGCIALRLGQRGIYDIMVEAGVRAEVLFAKMAALGLTGDDSAEDEEEEEQAQEQAGEEQAGEEQVEEEQEQPAAKKQKIDAETAVPVLASNNSPEEKEKDEEENKDEEKKPLDYSYYPDNETYLKSKLRYKPGILLDEEDNAVMMQWEDEIMGRHTETLAPKEGLRTMNVGHGMGLVDTHFLARKPAMHHIVEAHPQVQEKLRREGWYDLPNVTVHEGRWQDVLPKLVEQGVVLDGIYYDTFAEDYNALKEFFAEYVTKLLAPEGRFGWYNGLGADRQICYDVYTKVAEMDLHEAGFETEWEDIAVPAGLHGSDQWKGTRRPYWTIDIYRLPINTFSK